MVNYQAYLATDFPEPWQKVFEELSTFLGKKIAYEEVKEMMNICQIG